MAATMSDNDWGSLSADDQQRIVGILKSSGLIGEGDNFPVQAQPDRALGILDWNPVKTICTIGCNAAEGVAVAACASLTGPAAAACIVAAHTAADYCRSRC